MNIPGENGQEELIFIMKGIGLTLTEKQRTCLAELHRTIVCNAESEGQYCCLDFLLGNFEVEED